LDFDFRRLLHNLGHERYVGVVHVVRGVHGVGVVFGEVICVAVVVGIVFVVSKHRQRQVIVNLQIRFEGEGSLRLLLLVRT